MTHIQNGNKEQSRPDPPSPVGRNPLFSQLELRILLDLEGELQWDSFLLSTAASAVERTQVYLHEHLPTHCHPLSETTELVRAPLTQDAEMSGNQNALFYTKNTIDTKQKSTCVFMLVLFGLFDLKTTLGWFEYLLLKTLPHCPYRKCLSWTQTKQKKHIQVLQYKTIDL